jgi:D-alanyl-D-alanine dipeptidase
MKQLKATDFIPLNIFEDRFPIRTNLVYAKPDHPDNHFSGLYHENAQFLWAHKGIVPVILLASLVCKSTRGWALQINDCLRPVEAQKKMADYGYDPSLVSLPGSGAHPRGMAIDMEPVNASGLSVEMGTSFDYFAESLDHNPAARDFTGFQRSADEIAGILTNRKNLDTAVQISANAFKQTIFPLPQEWWDFRFEESVWSQYQPVSEKDLPSYMHLVSAPEPAPANIIREWGCFADQTAVVVACHFANLEIRLG